MTNDRILPSELSAEFNVSLVCFVEETAIANIWKVRRTDGQFAALKSYKKSHMGNEGRGFEFLKSLNGGAAALVFDQSATCALIEWLDGPSLGDLTRSGKDEQASVELVGVANRIHAESRNEAIELPLLEDWFEALFSTGFGTDCPEEARRNIMRSRDIARHLLNEQKDIQPLHGDLHHDNIRLGERGYCAFDAKGVMGERTYELANAFRNPKGAPELIRDPERIKYLCRLWSKSLCVEPHRLMQWAAVKSALSIVWHGSGTVKADPEFDLLDVFLSILDER
ncbi:MAG: aminoglycoside phosphotransferase family protein [Marinosulfonomonas sp.]